MAALGPIVSLDTGRTVEVDPRDRRELDGLRALGHLLDDAVRIPGTQYRIGADPVLGLLPVAGDAVAALASVYIVLRGVTLGVPRSVAIRMLLVVAAEFVVGSIPLLGPVIDAGWKVNVSNVETIESHVTGTT